MNSLWIEMNKILIQYDIDFIIWSAKWQGTTRVSGNISFNNQFLLCIHLVFFIGIPGHWYHGNKTGYSGSQAGIFGSKECSTSGKLWCCSFSFTFILSRSVSIQKWFYIKKKKRWHVTKILDNGKTISSKSKYLDFTKAHKWKWDHEYSKSFHYPFTNFVIGYCDHFCLSVCLSVCVSVCLCVTFSVNTITQERIIRFWWNLVRLCITIIGRSSSKMGYVR